MDMLLINKFPKIESIWLKDSTIDFVQIGYPSLLTNFKLENITISAEGKQNIIEQFYKFRKGFDNAVTLDFITTGTFNAETTAMINGTGIYAGDGLVDNNFTVNIS